MSPNLGRRLLILYMIVIFVFYYFPIITTVFFSFNAGSGLGLPVTAFSLRWYVTVLSSSTVIDAAFTSIKLAVVVAMITTLVVLSSALAMREKFRGQDFILYVFLLGIVMPGIIYGLGELLFYADSHVELSFWTAVPIQVVFAVPFGLLLLLIRFNPSLTSYENVARTLGASEWTAFREITFPLIRNEVVAAGLFGFTLSMSELARTSLVLSGSPTLPIYTFSYISQYSLTPDFYALASMVVAISIVFIACVGFLTTRRSAANNEMMPVQVDSP